MRYTFLFSILLLVLFSACSKDKFSSTPSLKYVSENTTNVVPGSELVFTLSFTDAEGDLTDSLTVLKYVPNCIADTFTQLHPLPEFPTTKNQKGNILVKLLYNVNSINTIGAPTCTPQNDTATFRFVLKDKAQHSSDTVSSPKIIIFNQ